MPLGSFVDLTSSIIPFGDPKCSNFIRGRRGGRDPSTAQNWRQMAPISPHLLDSQYRVEENDWLFLAVSVSLLA